MIVNLLQKKKTNTHTIAKEKTITDTNSVISK